MTKKKLRSIYKLSAVSLLILSFAMLEALVSGGLVPIVALGLIPFTVFSSLVFFVLSAGGNKKKSNARVMPCRADNYYQKCQNVEEVIAYKKNTHVA